MSHDGTKFENADYLLKHGGEILALGSLAVIGSEISRIASLEIVSLLFFLISPMLLFVGLMTVRAGIFESGTQNERRVELGDSTLKFFLALVLSFFALELTDVFSSFPLVWVLNWCFWIISLAMICLVLVNSFRLSRG